MKNNNKQPIDLEERLSGIECDLCKAHTIMISACYGVDANRDQALKAIEIYQREKMPSPALFLAKEKGLMNENLELFEKYNPPSKEKYEEMVKRGVTFTQVEGFNIKL